MMVCPRVSCVRTSQEQKAKLISTGLPGHLGVGGASPRRGVGSPTKLTWTLIGSKRPLKGAIDMDATIDTDVCIYIYQYHYRYKYRY